MIFMQLWCFFIITFSIPLLFRFKNWLYKKQNLEIKKSEEYVFLLSSFTVLLSYGLIVKQPFAIVISGAFLYWLLYDAIKFEINFIKNLRR